MSLSGFRCIDRLRVRWAEIDAQKIVFNGHYLMYFDTAMGAYWRGMAMPYAETMARLEGDLFVRKATLDYRGSARYDELLDVGIRCKRVGTSSIVFEGAVARHDRLLVTCELVYVFADPATQTSRAVPQVLRDALLGFEAGEAMVEVRAGSWPGLATAASALRARVFVEEQGVAAEIEADGLDATALHAVAFNRFGAPLATGRLLAHAPGVGRIGRMAVSQTLRGTGVGRAVLDALIEAARARGDTLMLLHAQVHAQRFYSRAGFTPRGAPFDEAGIAHVEMVRSI